MGDSVEINGVRYQFREPSRMETDGWNRKWKMPLAFSSIFEIEDQIKGLEKDVLNEKVKVAVAKQLIDMKLSMIEEIKSKYLGDIEIDGIIVTKEAISSAERMALSISTPKISGMDLLRLTEKDFITLTKEISRFNQFDNPLYGTLDDALLILKDLKTPQVELIQIIKVLESIKNGTYQKKE